MQTTSPWLRVERGSHKNIQVPVWLQRQPGCIQFLDDNKMLRECVHFYIRSKLLKRNETTKEFVVAFVGGVWGGGVVSLQ